MNTFRAALILAMCLTKPSLSQDHVPQTSGFSGYLLVGFGNFNVESNLLVTGPPLIEDAGYAQVNSIFESARSKSALAAPFAGEVNYTFAKTRTQIFFGNRLEDILRLDVPFGLGIRQELPDSSIVAASLLTTPAELKYWEDPYVEGEDRIRTGLQFPGLRLRWGQVLGTGLELTATFRWYNYDVEKSGDWLVNQGRLDPLNQALLNRDGKVIRLQALYRIDINRHRFEPTLRYINDDHNGEAIANTGFTTKLTYLYRSRRAILDANVGYGKRSSNARHPVYNETVEANRIGLALTVFFPVKLFKSNRWMVWLSGETFTEDTNVDFFDSRFTAFMGGLGWRHNRR